MPVREPFAWDGLATVRIASAVAVFADATVAPAAHTPAEAMNAAVAAVAAVAGHPMPVLYGEQRHTALAFVYGQHGPLAATAHRVGVCDALLTAETHVALAVLTADCLPIALAGPGVAGMIHAGWRGLAEDILGKVVRRVYNEFGVAPADLAAAVGVGIGPCHYRVGAEVVAALANLPVEGDAWAAAGTVDLAAWATGRLQAIGLPVGAITRMRGCTACSPRHHSYRRDGLRAGRQWSAVFLTAA